MLSSRHLFLFLLFISNWSYGQNNPFAFHHLTEKNGLSNGIVNCFLKDSKGLLWIGTYEGLNRFDGTHFYPFQRTKSPTSIFNNVVHSLCEDKQNHIWGATESGIIRYDPVTNTFKSYSSPNSKNSTVSSNIARAVQNILCDKNGNIWATGIWTILKYNPTKDAFEEITPLTTNYDSLSSYSVRKNGLIEDPSGKGLWLATRVGLHYYDFATNKFTSFKNDSNPLFSRRNVAALSKSPSGQCWLYDNSQGRIYGFDPATQKTTWNIDMMTAMPGAVGATIFEDSENRLWFCSWNAGLAVVDYKRNIITRFQNEINDPSSINNNFFWAAREDEDGTIWLGTGSGISICNSSKSIYRIHRFTEKFSFLKDNSIRTIVEDPVDKSWWLVTRNKLYVIHYFPTTGLYASYDLEKASKDANGSLPGPVYSIQFLRNRPVLTTHYGAWEIDTLSNKVIPFQLSPAINPKFVIKSIIEHGGNYYLSNINTLFRYNIKSGKADSISYTLSKFKDGQRPIFGQLYIGTDNRVWFISAFGWMSYLDDNDKIVSHYLFKNEEEEMSGYFTSWSPDKKGNIWLASVGVGLYRYTPSTQGVKYWNQTDGLVNNKITTAVEDGNGSVWAAAGNKFSVFNPEAETFYNFKLPFAANEINYDNGQALLSNGSVAVTVKNDVIEFIPSRLNLTPHIRMPLIGAVNIAGTEKYLVNENELHLEPDEKFLSLKFGMLTDPEVFPYSFEYMLEGLDDKWMESGPENQAVYNKLPSGNYTFRLRAKARNGTWKSPEKTLKIHIKTPFLRSSWFYTLAIIFSCGLFVLFYRFRTRKQRQLVELTSKAQMLEKEKALVMYENLKQHLNPHFLFNSLTSLGSLIRINQAMAGDFLDKMSKVYRYILKNRDNEVVPLGEELKFVQLYIDLQKTRFEAGLDVNVNVDEEHYHRKIAPVTLQNLVENAIKHNTSEPNSPLRISLYVMNDYMIVRNNLQRKSFVETSNKQGLSNMESLYHYLSNRPMLIIEDEQYFTVKIPLL